jgi:hypothetical protein
LKDSPPKTFCIGRRESGKANNVARGIDVRNGSAVVFVDLEITAISGRKACRDKIEGASVSAPSSRNKDRFGFHNAPRLQR